MCSAKPNTGKSKEQTSSSIVSNKGTSGGVCLLSRKLSSCFADIGTFTLVTFCVDPFFQIIRRKNKYTDPLEPKSERPSSKVRS